MPVTPQQQQLLSPRLPQVPAPPVVLMPTIAQSAGIGVMEQQQQPLTPKKKSATPVVNGAPPGSGSGSGGGGGTAKKRGMPPEGLPPIVVASA